MASRDRLARPPEENPADPAPASSDERGDLRRAAMQRRWLQRKASSDGGQPLETGVRRQVEHATGADLSAVRVHTGVASQAAAASVAARAYTVGQDVHFGAGAYQPGSVEGDRLIAHELIHTVQQGSAGELRQDKLEVSQPGDAAEREADELADAIVDRGGQGAHTPSAQPVQAARAPLIQRTPDGAAEPEAAPAPEDEAQPGADQPVVARLHLNSDVETVDRTKLTIPEMAEAKVGHSWITLEWVDPEEAPPADVGEPTHKLLDGGGKAPMGFWPLVYRAEDWDPQSAQHLAIQQRLDEGETPGAGADSNPQHTGYSVNPFSSFVPGRVEEPDDAHSAKATKTFDLKRAQVEGLMAYVNSKRNAEYSLYFYNCTTFAIEAAQAAGQDAPGGSELGVCLPNALYRDILQLKLKGDPTATTTPLKPGEEETPNQKKVV
jgi:hypothetical protein